MVTIMKKISKYLLLLATVVFTFAACEDDIKRDPSPTFDGTAVFFPVSAESEELEPTATLAHAITIARDTNNNEALTVKLVVKQNTSKIFTVPETVVFAAGQRETKIEVLFPQAQVDSTYTLALEVELDNANPYLIAKPNYSYTVNIAKWDIVVGKQAIVFDGLVNAFYGTGNPGWYVSYARKNNADGSFDIRLFNPYTVLPEYEIIGGAPDYDKPIADDFGLYKGFPYNYPEDVDSEGTYNWTIHVAKNGKATFDNFAMGMTWSYGAFSARYYDPTIPGVFLADDQSITFPKGSSACFMEDYGGRLTSEDIVIFLDDALWKDINSVIRVADLEDGFNDASISWNEVPAKLSTIESTVKPGLIETTLENAIDPNPEDKQGPGSDFYNLYRLTNVYTEGFCLAFYWDTIKSKISLPLDLQPTGMVFAGKEIFVGPSAENESFVEETEFVGKPGLKFHFFLQVQTADGGNLGEFEEVYYFSNEDIIWGEKAEDFAGTYKMTGPSQFDGEAPADVDVEIVFEDEKLFLTGLQYASPIAIEFDDATKVISIAPQELDSLYGKYDITLYTTDAEGVSESARMQFAMGFGGTIKMTDDSEADGYLLRSEAAGGWLDGYYNLAFTPIAPADGAPAKAPKAISVKSALTAHEHVTAVKQQNNWKIRGQVKKHNFFFKKDAGRVF